MLARWLAVAGLAGGPASPEEPPPSPVVELAWTAPAECPDGQAVLDEIVRLVGRPLGQDPTRTLVATGRVDREADGGYHLVLELRLGDARASRELSTRSCGTLLEPAAVMVAVAVDPRLDAPAQDDDAPASVPEAPAVPTPPPIAEREAGPARPQLVAAGEPEVLDELPPSVPRARARARPRAVIGVAGGMAVGAVPRVGASLKAGVGVLLPRLRIELEGVHLFRRRMPGPIAGTSAMLRITAARPVVCARLGGSRVEVPLCGGIELGVLRAEGLGVSEPAVRRHAWVAAHGSTGVAVRVLPWLALRLRAGVALGLLRREFTLLGASIATTGVADARLGMGVEVRLP